MLDRKYNCGLKTNKQSDFTHSVMLVQKPLADANACIFTAASSQMIMYNKNIVHLQYHGPLSLTDSLTTQNCGPDSLTERLDMGRIFVHSKILHNEQEYFK